MDSNALFPIQRRVMKEKEIISSEEYTKKVGKDREREDGRGFQIDREKEGKTGLI